MADEVDVADEYAQKMLESDLYNIRKKAALIPVGEPGECEKCAEDTPRLVNGICCRCRDKFHLP